MGISQYRLAKDISVPPKRINEIVHGKRSITADTALRLGRFFEIAPQFWLNLQNRFDHDVTEELLGLFAHGFHVVFTAKTPELHIVERDPDDNMFIKCAVALKAEFVITGDKALKAIQKYMT